MNKQELLKIAKPILFNTEMVQAILGGRKTVTRRTIPKNWFGLEDIDKNDSNYLYFPDKYGDYHHAKDLCRYQPGDVLYVREKIFGTAIGIHNQDLCYATHCPCGFSDEEHAEVKGWTPSIHMPKSAARIFLKVTDVRVERLQDITVGEIEKEGYPGEIDFSTMPIAMQGIMFEWWANTWNSTIKKQDMDKYSLKANPWIWVIEFERIGVE